MGSDTYLRIVDNVGTIRDFGQKITAFRYLSDHREMIEFMDIDMNPVCWYPERLIDHIAVMKKEQKLEKKVLGV